MAWADLLMGVVIMPVHCQYNVVGSWMFGHVGCKVRIQVERRIQNVVIVVVWVTMRGPRTQGTKPHTKANQRESIMETPSMPHPAPTKCIRHALSSQNLPFERTLPVSAVTK